MIAALVAALGFLEDLKVPQGKYLLQNAANRCTPCFINLQICARRMSSALNVWDLLLAACSSSKITTCAFSMQHAEAEADGLCWHALCESLAQDAQQSLPA